MNAFARTEREMILAMRANFQVLVQLLVENHGAASLALGPKPLGNFALLGFARRQLRLFNKGGFGGGRGRRCDGRFTVFQAESLFGKCGRAHLGDSKSNSEPEAGQAKPISGGVSF